MSTDEVPEVDPLGAQRALVAGAVLLDVREPSEWQAGRAPGARHIPLGELAARAEEIPTGTEIVVVCRSGARSLLAAGALRAAGYPAANLAGGMQAWELAGLPVVADAGPGSVI